MLFAPNNTNLTCDDALLANLYLTRTSQWRRNQAWSIRPSSKISKRAWTRTQLSAM